VQPAAVRWPSPTCRKFACHECGTLSGDVRAGREFDLESIELADDAAIVPGET
jgi:Zn finger protein HypA/HybF involved in hydrogenase expression